jgi:MFS superfamily sulfate permease-like transporter
VIAGYLAYVGYFCCAAGLAQGTTLAIGAPPSIALLFKHPESLPKAAATIGCALVIFSAIRMWKSAAALPGILMLIPAIWYVGLSIYIRSHRTHWHDVFQMMAINKWSAPIPGAANQQFWEVYRFLAPANIDWGAIARQIPTMLALCFVCSFGTSMDVIAGAHAHVVSFSFTSPDAR